MKAEYYYLFIISNLIINEMVSIVVSWQIENLIIAMGRFQKKCGIFHTMGRTPPPLLHVENKKIWSKNSF